MPLNLFHITFFVKYQIYAKVLHVKLGNADYVCVAHYTELILNDFLESQ